MPNQQQAQRLTSQVKSTQNQMQQLQQRKQKVESTIEKLKEIREGLGELPEDKKEAMSPIGAGVYAPSEVKNTGKVLVNVGSDVVVEKEVNEATNYLGDREDQLMQLKQRYQQQLQKLQKKYQEMVKKIREIRQGQGQNVQ